MVFGIGDYKEEFEKELSTMEFQLYSGKIVMKSKSNIARSALVTLEVIRQLH